MTPKPGLSFLITFLLIFGLTQSHNLITYASTPGLLGLPTWLWYFMGFHALLVVVLYFFSRSEASNR